MIYDWAPNSWEDFSATQLPSYEDKNLLNNIKKKLRNYPQIVSIDEVLHLKNKLVEASEGRHFILQGGDCAESFRDFDTLTIQNTFKVLLQMSLILNFSLEKPIIRICRIAGQFAKPRSERYEIKNAKKLLSYRGDIINGYEFDDRLRKPNPKRMLNAYFQSTATLNYLRAFSNGKYADIEEMLSWMLQFINDDTTALKFEHLKSKINRGLSFVKTKALPTTQSNRLGVDFYTSHEALLLDYEESLCRHDASSKSYYSSSAHFLWVGDRTKHLTGAHVEFLSGIINPIGIKCGPDTDPTELIGVINKLNPDNRKGKIVLIIRMGCHQINKKLGPIISTIKINGKNVIWISDPMHGNTEKSNSGVKTRLLLNIINELKSFFMICNDNGVYPAGVHLEMTGKPVTECIGGRSQVNLYDNYETLCDPRLNGEQSLELAFELSDIFSLSRR